MSMIDSKRTLNMEEQEFKKSSTPMVVKIVIGVLVVLCLALLIVVIVLAVKGKDASAKDSPDAGASAKDEICVTPGCASAAGLALQYMDLDAKPCEDFFQFSCGGFLKKYPIPDERTSYSTFSYLSDDLNVKLKGLLEDDSMNEGAPKTVKELKELYQSCINEELIEEIGVKPLIDLTDGLGGWPVINSTWDESNFNLMGLLVKLRRYNNRYIIDSYVSADDKNSTVNILQIDQQSVRLPSREYYLENKFADRVAAYRKYFIDITTALGTNQSIAEADASAVINFEINIANLTVPKEERRDSEALYHRMTILDLYTNISSKIDWLSYFNGVFEEVGIVLDNSTELVNYSPEYFTKVLDLVADTPKRVLANYMIWRIVDYRVPNLPKKFQRIREEFNKALYGDVKQEARWKTCVGYANSFLGHAVGRLFVNKYFPKDAKASAISMIAEVRKAFNDLLVDVDWMDDETRKIAKVKASKISEKIGYPEWVNNDTALNEKYKGIDIDPKQFFSNYIELLNWQTRDSLDELEKPYDKEKWVTVPAVVNAFYSSSRNQISFPAGILQPPFWQNDRPMSMNFGSIGTVIGHEITHGFDDQGRQFDGDGNLIQWWSDSVIEEFKKKAECIKKQYGGYLVEQVNMTLNGINTQGENIADNGGIKQAHKAYREWRKNNKEIGILPGLKDYSLDKLFFIAFAQSWCSEYRDRSLVNAIQAGVHSPGYFRVIGTLSNFKEFSDTFQCAAGSRMNPAEKCSVW